MKTLDYIRRKWQQDLRDMVFGHNYVLDGQNFLVPKSASLVARRAIQKGLKKGYMNGQRDYLSVNFCLKILRF